MNRTEYIARIKAAYEGELYGETWFATMAGHAVAPDRQRKLAAIAQLEYQTRSRMTPLITRLGITGIDEAAQREKGMRLAREHARQSWPAFIGWFIEEIGRFVTLYDEMERNSTEEDAAILGELARHERALLEFARLEAAGLPDRSLEPVLALLNTRSAVNSG
ncbi:hypothetical protein [Paraburkholderia diazotrophica]|uniref:Ferritin-like metal-binding protein YciE n=1 Tax=Paraburkholderia diazotrophica TaxID=667676 RepID=A0A1H6YAR4_9BURK|nr:hypothetical protein [Paraburkholderia diazotrophica]SEJ38339.1 hypothetical protein SAMN05192539_101043 [Paraburkholderia diazotrophica]